MAPDFSGWATVAGLKCSDGLTIVDGAFSHQDKQRVPLVWMHGHSDVDNVLGYAILEHKAGKGVYAKAYFNETPKAKNAKIAVEHGDITKLSIWANRLDKRGPLVHNGNIREVSLVMAGANPGAEIDYVNIKHSDGYVETSEDDIVIHTGTEIVLGENAEEDNVNHADGAKTPLEIFDSMDSDQKELLRAMVSAAADGATAQHSDDDTEAQQNTKPSPPIQVPDPKTGSAPVPDQNSPTENGDDAESADADQKTDDSGTESDDEADNEGDLNHQEGSDMPNATQSRNVFDQNKDEKPVERHYLSHAEVQGIMQDAIKKGSLKDAVEDYALSHGIDDIDTLFPDPKLVTSSPEFDSRRMEWVKGVLNQTRKVPFSRIKNLVANITQDAARAKGYIKGTMKKEEWFGVSGRSTTPTTVYKKQALDRDDIVDITDFDMVAWLKGEMRIMLEEELARAILIGDGRDVGDEDKIKDPAGAAEGAGIRSILNDHELYAATIRVNVDDANSSPTEIVDAIVSGMALYKGSGNPTLYTTLPQLTKILLERDSLGRRLRTTVSDVAAEMGVSNIVTVEVMEEVSDLVGIIVNLQDYTIGADRGGEVNTFDDFDIDYNKNKYLIETRVSGALTKIRSAVIIKKVAASAVVVTPNAPSFVEGTGVVTIPTQTGVVYKNADTNATLTAGAQSALAAGATLNVIATPASGYYFADNQHDEWAFTRPSA